MTDLFYDKYDGEMFFDIEDIKKGSEEYSFTIKAQYDGKIIGARVSVPVLIRRSLFKTYKFIKTNSQLKITSIGQESDDFICALESLLKPPYKSSRHFSDEPDPIDFSVLNRELYDIDSDKIYLKLFNGEDQSDFDEDEKINLEMNFTFNLSSNKASLIEVRDGYSADIIAILMK